MLTRQDGSIGMHIDLLLSPLDLKARTPEVKISP